MKIEGACHCGNIAFELTWEPEPTEIRARACGCTFCVKHGGVWTSNPSGTLMLRERDRDAVNHYAFGTRTASFHVCRQCGVVPVVTSEIDGHTYAVVNVNAFTNMDRSRVVVAPMSYEGEETAGRLERRKRNWIGHVRHA